MSTRLLPLLMLLSACPPAPVTPPAPPLVVDIANDGTFSVSRNGAGLSGLHASATLDGVERALSSPEVVSAEVDDALGHAHETTLTSTDATTRLTLTLRAYPDFLTAQLSVACVTSCAGVRVEGFTVTGDVSTQTAEPAAALVNGYSSWAPSYYATVQRSAAPGADVENTGNNDNHLITDARLSWWLGALTLRNDAALVTGALTAETWKSKVLTWREPDGVKLRVRNGGHGDSLPLTTVRSERLFFTAGAGLTDALSRWSHAVATLTPPPTAPFVPIGWNSWNTLFEGVTETNAMANAATLRTLGFEANNVQLDDGWEDAWGNWTPNTKFPSGLNGLSTQLEAQQLTRGCGSRPSSWTRPCRRRWRTPTGSCATARAAPSATPSSSAVTRSTRSTPRTPTRARGWWAKSGG